MCANVCEKENATMRVPQRIVDESVMLVALLLSRAGLWLQWGSTPWLKVLPGRMSFSCP